MLYLTLWIFFVYAFLGWCTEVGYAALRTMPSWAGARRWAMPPCVRAGL